MSTSEIHLNTQMKSESFIVDAMSFKSNISFLINFATRSCGLIDGTNRACERSIRFNFHKKSS